MLKTDIVSFRDTQVAFAAKTDKELKTSFKLFKRMNNSSLLALGTSLVKIGLKLHLPITGLIKKTVFKQFCGGETLKECDAIIAKLAKKNIKSILDFSVEGVFKVDELDRTRDEIIRTVKKAALDPNIPFAVFKMTGICFSEVLEMKQNGILETVEDEAKYDRAFKRAGQICRQASDNQVKVLIDAEESWIQDSIDEIAQKMMKSYNKEKAIVFNTYQLYRIDGIDRLKAAIEHSKIHGYILGVKLVRGAYMEKEAEKAKEENRTSLVFSNKFNSDDAYNEALELCLKNIGAVELVAGTHNEYSCYYLASLMGVYNLENDDSRIWFSQLYGMGDHISFNLSKKGFNVAKYVPYGKVRYVMPYLFRRAQENTSVADQASREFKLLQWEMKRRGLY